MPCFAQHEMGIIENTENLPRCITLTATAESVMTLYRFTLNKTMFVLRFSNTESESLFKLIDIAGGFYLVKVAKGTHQLSW